MGPEPTRAVLEAFGLAGAPVALAGGAGVSFRVGDVVIKRVHDPAEAAWCQDLLSRIDGDGARVPEPLRGRDGGWVQGAWTASRYIDGLRSAVPRWAEIADVGLRFGDACERARRDGGDVLSGRGHRWARADRVVWGQAAADPDIAVTWVYQRAVGLLLPEPPAGEHIVHGDLSGNVFHDPWGVPVVLDLSPYLRPRPWAAAIVIADAVLWHGADPSLARGFADGRAGRDLLARALIFRMVAEQLSTAPRHGAQLGLYQRVLDALT